MNIVFYHHHNHGHTDNLQIFTIVKTRDKFRKFRSPVKYSAANEPIVFAGDRDYPPFESIKEGEPVGLNIDILKALSKAMGRDIEIRLMKWSDAQQLLRDGKVDALTEMAYSEPRAEFFDFSDNTVLYKYSFFVNKENKNINDATDAEGKNTAVTKGGYPNQFLESNKNIKLHRFYIIADHFSGE